MPIRGTVVEFPEILRHAENVLGIPWNTGCRILDRFRPQYEINSIKVERNELEDQDVIDDYEYTPDQIKIMLSFLDSIKCKSCTIIND